MDKNTTKEYELDIEKFKKICEINSPKGIVFRQGNIPSPESRGTLMSLGCPPYETSVLGYFSNDFFTLWQTQKQMEYTQRLLLQQTVRSCLKGLLLATQVLMYGMKY